jgi:integrase/recombinase XerD
MLSPLLLERLRTWWKVAHAKDKMLDGGWLFPRAELRQPNATKRLRILMLKSFANAA